MGDKDELADFYAELASVEKAVAEVCEEFGSLSLCFSLLNVIFNVCRMNQKLIMLPLGHKSVQSKKGVERNLTSKPPL